MGRLHPRQVAIWCQVGSACRLGWLTWGEIYGWLVERYTRCDAAQIAWIGQWESYLMGRSLLKA